MITDANENGSLCFGRGVLFFVSFRSAVALSAKDRRVRFCSALRSSRARSENDEQSAWQRSETNGLTLLTNNAG